MTASSAPKPSLPDSTDAEMRTVDAILDKADALLRRHQSPLPSHGNDTNAADDLPVLLDVVDDSVLHPRLQGHIAPPFYPAPDETPAPAQPHPTAADLATLAGRGSAADDPDTDLIEDLISLDTSISRAIEDWLTREMPPLVVHELERFNVQLRETLLEHARATLLPTLSKRIANRIERHIRR